MLSLFCLPGLLLSAQMVLYLGSVRSFMTLRNFVKMKLPFAGKAGLHTISATEFVLTSKSDLILEWMGKRISQLLHPGDVLLLHGKQIKLIFNENKTFR